MPLSFAVTVLVQSSAGRFMARAQAAHAEALCRAGHAVPVGAKRQLVRIIRMLESVVNESALRSLHDDSRRLTWRQNCGGHEIVSLKRYDERTGTFRKDDKV